MLLAGLKVTLAERSEIEASTAHDRVIKTLEASLARGLISEAKFKTIKAVFETTDDYQNLQSSI